MKLSGNVKIEGVTLYGSVFKSEYNNCIIFTPRRANGKITKRQVKEALPDLLYCSDGTDIKIKKLLHQENPISKTLSIYFEEIK